MSITTTLVRRGLVANKWRLALTAMAVVLGVSFVSGSFILRDSLKNVFNDLANDINTGVDVQVRTKVAFGQRGTGDPVPAELVSTVRKVEGVTAAEGNMNVAGVTIIGKDGKAKLPLGGPTLGSPWTSDESLTIARITQGRAPTGAKEVVFDRNAANKAGYRVGDKVRLSLPTGRAEATLVGTFSYGPKNRTAGAFLVAFDAKQASKLLGLEGDYQTIDVHGTDGIDQKELARRIQATLPSRYEAVDQETLIKDTQEQFGGFVDGFGNGLLAFALIALFVSCFIINNTFAILATQRLRELALLRAVGASTTQIRTMMAIESLAVGVSASVLGVIGGVGLAALLKAIMGIFLGSLPGGVTITPAAIVIGLAVGIIVTVASAISPAIKAGTIPPVVAMSNQHTFSVGRPKLRLFVASVAALGGLALLITGLFVRPGDTAQWLSFAGLGAIALFLGIAGLSRLIAKVVLGAQSAVLRPLARCVSWPFSKLLGRTRDHMIGPLARENLIRTPRRTAAAAAALMIGLAFVATGSVIGSSIKETVNEQLKTSITADLFLQDKSFAGIPATTVAAITKVEGIESVSGYSGTAFQINGSEKFVGAVDHTTFGELVDISLTSGGWEQLTEGTVLLYKDPAKDLKATVGTKIEVTWPSATKSTLTVVGIYDDAAVAGNYIIDRSTYTKYVPGKQLDFFAGATITPGASLEQVKSDVKTFLLDEAPAVDVQDRDEFRRSQQQQVDVLIITINVLLALAVIIAFIGIANTLALSVYERTREIGLLRAVGMQRAQSKNMVRWESVLIAVFGAVLGLALGVGLGALVSKALPDGIVSTIAIPFGSLAGYLLLSIVAGTVAAFFPARRASRLDILTAIAQQ
jgi:putative ABC transport system permease protein